MNYEKKIHSSHSLISNAAYFIIFEFRTTRPLKYDAHGSWKNYSNCILLNEQQEKQFVETDY